MPKFASVKALEDYIKEGLRKTVEDGRNKAYDVIHASLLKFYGEYKPEFFKRTEQVLNSLVKSEVVPTKNGYEARVYFDIGKLHHPESFEFTRYSKRKGTVKKYSIERKWSEERILNSVMLKGHHIYGAKSTAVWVESMAQLNAEFMAFLKKELIDNGIPVR